MYFRVEESFTLLISFINIAERRLRDASGLTLVFHRAGVPSVRAGHFMWVSWWMKRSLGRFFSVFLPFSSATNFIPTVLHLHLIHFVCFISYTPMIVRQVRSVSFLITHRPSTEGLHRISTLDPALCQTRVENIYILSNIVEKTPVYETMH